MGLVPLSAAAKVLGISKTSLLRAVRGETGPGLVAERRGGLGFFVDLDAARVYVEAHFPRATATPSGAAVPSISDAPSALPLAAEDESLLAVLKSPSASAVDLLDAALRLAARRVAQAGAVGVLGARDVADLTRASEELRRAREAALDLAERQKRVIDRDVAAGAVGDLVERLIQILNSVQTMLPAQVEQWREDPHHHNLSAKDRARVVMEWFEAQARSMRIEVCDQVEAALDQAEKDAAR